MSEELNGKFTEYELENAIIDFITADELYAYECGDTMGREDTEILIRRDLEKFLRRRYMAEQLTDAEVDSIIARLENISASPLYYGNRETHNLLVDGFDFSRLVEGKQPVHISFIDFEDLEQNIFKAVNQYAVKDREDRRPDMLIFVNGIPVVIWEFKTAIEENKTVFDAWEQIAVRYTRALPNLLKYCSLAVITDGVNTKMGSVFTPYEFFYAWNKVEWQDEDARGMESLLKMIKGAFRPDRLLQLIRDFVFYPDPSQDGKGVDCPIVCRYPQYFAAVNMFNNLRKHMRCGNADAEEQDGKGGIYFGATGCGKTYAMLFLTRLLIHRDNEKLKNPTIILLVDRDDLDSQISEVFENATKFLGQKDVRSFESRKDLGDTLNKKPSGGVYITTIQKFAENTGLLSERNNIICISDEAHRTQSGVTEKAVRIENEIYFKKGFAGYLREAFPNAVYCGFTGTPTMDSVSVFGPVVDRYTMQQAVDDEITVRISYLPRLARVLMDEKKAKEIDKYYNECFQQGSSAEQIEKSKRAMSGLESILGDDERLDKLATDFIEHYEAMRAEKPQVVQKAMVVCTSRPLAYKLLQVVKTKRPEWFVPKKTEKTGLAQEELEKLVEIPKINLVATQGANDSQELFDACGNDAHRKLLEKQFKNDNSNFQIAIVVDMWITGFDVPSLTVMYVDKIMIGHTLIQTISRVNRVFKGKDRGLVVDYIGIEKNMQTAMKTYSGDGGADVVDQIEDSVKLFRNELEILDGCMAEFDARDYYFGSPAERFICLSKAAEFAQRTEKEKTFFMGHAKRMGLAFDICRACDKLTDEEISKAWFYKAVRSIVYKQTNVGVPDAEVMNRHVEKMVQEALSCSGVEDIMQMHEEVDLYSESFKDKLESIDMPNTKFNVLLKLLKQAIKDYGKVNKIKAQEFSEKLAKVVEKYNTRENVGDKIKFVDMLSNDLTNIAAELHKDQKSFEKLGITYEEKAFYDILIKVRDEHGFPYEEEKCKELAKQIAVLVEDTTKYNDWDNRENIKATLQRDLVLVLYENDYPPDWNEDVFQKVLAQAENMKKNLE